MSRNTQPTPIVDKNGKQTTVHKATEAKKPNSRVAGLKATPEFEANTLTDIRAAAESAVAVSADSSTPTGHTNAIVKFLGVTTNYLLREASSGVEDEAVIVGRVELADLSSGMVHRGSFYRGSRLKGGEFLGTLNTFDEAFHRITNPSREELIEKAAALPEKDAISSNGRHEVGFIAKELNRQGAEMTRQEMHDVIDTYADEGAIAYAHKVVDLSYRQFSPKIRDTKAVYPLTIGQAMVGGLRS